MNEASANPGSPAAVSRNPWPPRDHPLFEELVCKMRPSILLDRLYSALLVNREEYNSLKAIPTEEKKSRKLLHDLLPRISPVMETFHQLCDILKRTEGQIELAELLEDYVDAHTPRPQPEKRATVFIRTKERRRVEQARGMIASMFRGTFNMPQTAIKLFDEEPTGDDGMPLVLSEEFTVTVFLHGIAKADFESNIKDSFIDVISGVFAVARDAVEKGIHDIYSGSVGIVLCLPLWEAGLQFITMRGNPYNEIKLMSALDNKIPQLSGVSIHVGGLPVWTLSLTKALRRGMENLAGSGYLWPSLLMDQAYHLGIINANQHRSYDQDPRNESEKALDFVHQINDEHLQVLSGLLSLTESHRLAADLLGPVDGVTVPSTPPSSPIPTKKKKHGWWRPGLRKSLIWSNVALDTVSIYVSDQCKPTVEPCRKRLFNFIANKFGIAKERVQEEELRARRGQEPNERVKNTMVLVCEDYKTVAIELRRPLSDKTSAQAAEILRSTLCQSLSIPTDAVTVRGVVEKDGTWVFLRMPLESIFSLMSVMVDPTQSTKWSKKLCRVLPEARGSRIDIGGLRSLSLLPISRLEGDWSQITAAIAIPGSPGEMLVCGSSDVRVVDVETTEVRKATGNDLAALVGCSALVSLGGKIYAFASGLYELTFDTANSSFCCKRLGKERWEGTLAACSYRRSILVVKRQWHLVAVPQANLYKVDTVTGSSQLLSAVDQPWSAIGALVNAADNEDEDHIVAICGYMWKLCIPADGGRDRVRSIKLNQTETHSFVRDGLSCFFETLTTGGWQFTRSAVVHGDKMAIATGKDYIPGCGGLYRVDPYCGLWSAIHTGWHTIHTLVEVDGHLMAFTKNKLYDIDKGW